jgi:hypothetical protein
MSRTVMKNKPAAPHVAHRDEKQASSSLNLR